VFHSLVMSEKYRFYNPTGIYFVTETITGWIDVFTKKEYATIILDSLDYCIKNKGLKVHAFVIMPSHLHLILSSSGAPSLSEIIRDFKKYTSRAILQRITNSSESRKEWMLLYFRQHAMQIKRSDQHKVWQDGSHPIGLDSPVFYAQRLNYIHQNPVKARFVNEPHHFVFSSASAYANLPCPLQVHLLHQGMDEFL